MFTFTLNQQQMTFLQTFLNRVDLKGAEVAAFNELVAAFKVAPTAPAKPDEPKE